MKRGTVQLVIVPMRRCRHCDDAVGKVNGEYVHVNGKYTCRGKQNQAAA